MRTFTGLVVCAFAATAAGGVSVQAQVAPTPKSCATVKGPTWTQTINLTGYLAPPKEPELRVIHGSRYNVFVDHVGCAWSTRQVSRLLPLMTKRRAESAAPAGYACLMGQKGWGIDGWNGDFVRRATPPTSVGACSTQMDDAVPGVIYPTFSWGPAKPCRSKGFQGDCHKV